MSRLRLIFVGVLLLTWISQAPAHASNAAPSAPASISMSPCLQGCVPVATSSLTPTFSAVSTDPDSPSLNYILYVRLLGTSTILSTTTSPATPPGTPVSLTVPAGVLVDGTEYEYRLAVTDGIATSYAPWTGFQTVIGDDTPVLVRTLNITSPVTFGHEGSPYVLLGFSTVLAGGTLTVEPGTVIKNASGRIVVTGGQLIADGTAAQPIYMTSVKDDTIGGDSGRDGPTMGAPGDYGVILRFDPTSDEASEAPTSIIDNVAFRYGGSADRCQTQGMVEIFGESRVHITHSEFTDSNSASIRMAGAVVGGSGSVSVKYSRFARHGVDGASHARGCGINTTASNAQIIGNLFEDPTAAGIWSLTTGAPAYGTLVKENWFYGAVTLMANVVATREDINFVHNAFYDGYTDFGGALKDPEDLSGNYWLVNHPRDYPLCVPPGEEQYWIPAVKTRTNTSCPGYDEAYDDFTKITPFSDAPPVRPVGLQADPVLPLDISDGQLLGSGDGEFAINPSGFQSDPVNTVNGSYVEQDTDLHVATKGEDLLATRTYNSADENSGPLGRGWSLSLTPRLSFPAQDTAVLTAGDGQQSSFMESNGIYQGSPGVTATLRHLTGGQYQVLTRLHVSYRFDANGAILERTDANGVSTSYNYGAGGELVSVSTAGRSLSLSWSDGLLTRVELPDGRHVDYGYQGGQLTSVRDLSGQTSSYAYGAAGRMVTKTDPLGRQVTRLSYDTATGRVSDQWDALDRHSSFTWDAATHIARMTDPRGGVWTDVYTGDTLTERRDPLQRTWRYEYGADLRMFAAVDPRGFRSQFSYDENGNMVAASTPQGTVLAEFDEQNNPVKVTNQRGFDTINSYDAAGNLLRVERFGKLADASVVHTFVYDSDGNLIRSTDPDGLTSEWSYDGLGDLASMTSPSGNETHFRYDQVGRLVSEVSPRGSATADPDDFTTTFEYDDSDHVVGITDPLGRVNAQSFNAAGELVSTTDAAGHSTSYAYFPDGHVESTQGPDPSMSPSRFGYDLSGNLTSVTDPSGRATSATYDAANQIVSRTNPILTESFGYNKNGELNSVTKPGNVVTRYYYTAAGRLSKVDYPLGTTDVTFTYSATGQRKSMVQGSRVVNYAYDPFDRLTQVVSGSDTFAYTYSPAGRVTSDANPLGQQTVLTYDAEGQLDEVRVGGQVQARYDYTPNGHVASAVLGDGSTRSYQYDEGDQLTRIMDIAADGRQNLDETYTYDATGNPVSVARGGGSQDVYTYDALDRLTGVCYDSATCAGAEDFVRWTYDPAGNRTSESRPSGVTNYDLGAAGQLQSTTSPSGVVTNYGYDNLGQLTSRGPTTYTYDASGRTTTETVGGVATTFSYDGDGRRLSATTSGTTTKFMWDPASYQLSAVAGGSNPLGRSYVYGLGPVSSSDGNATSYLHTDAQGSVRVITDALAASVWTRSYEPYGLPRSTSGPGPAVGLGWAGQYEDPSGEVHLRARQYDPVAGSFLTPDPASATDPGATYGYADSNPLTGSDPLGLWPDGAPSWDTITYVAQNIIGVTPFGGVLTGYRSCTEEKGSCGPDVIAMAAISAAGARGLGGAANTARIAEGTLSPTLKVGERSFIYGDRVLARAAEEGGPYHNFPASFDSHVLSQGTRTQVSEGYVEYTLRGSVNGIDGVYEIGARPSGLADGEVITHRFFRPGR